MTDTYKLNDRPKKAKYQILVYKDAKGQWRWNITHRNGKIIAASSEGYNRSSGALRSLNRLIDALKVTDYVYRKDD